MNLLVSSDRLSMLVVVALSLAVGYGLAVGQRNMSAWRERRRQQQQLASILRSAEALQGDIWPPTLGVNGTMSPPATADCGDIATFETALLAQIERLISYERRLQADLASARALLNHRSAELAASHNEARTDPLSALLNRRGFDEMLEVFLRNRLSGGRHFAILLIDIDHFKPINDTHGHLIGDRVLTWVGTRLTEVVRPTDCVARFGGDEFAILLRDVGMEQAECAGRRLLQEFRQRPFVADGEQFDVPVTLSIGVAVAELKDTPNSLIRKADAALYLSKQQGRDQLQAYSASHVPPHGSWAAVG